MYVDDNFFAAQETKSKKTKVPISCCEYKSLINEGVNMEKKKMKREKATSWGGFFLTRLAGI